MAGSSGTGSSTRCSRRRSRPRDIALGQPRLDRGPAAARSRRSSCRDRRCSARPTSPLHRARDPRRGADRPRLRGADRGLLGDPADARPVRRALPVRRHAAVPVLGHVLPDRVLPDAPPAARLAHAAVARRRADAAAWRSGTLGTRPGSLAVIHLVVAAGVRRSSARGRRSGPSNAQAGARMTRPARLTPLFALGSRRSLRLIERNLLVYRPAGSSSCRASSSRCSTCSAIGFGLGALVGDVPGPTASRSRTRCSSRRRCSPASAMNGAIIETTFNFFFKLNYEKTYDAILGDAAGAGRRRAGRDRLGADPRRAVRVGFLVVMVVLGLVVSPWASWPCRPRCFGFAFAAVGMAATTFMRTWQDFDLIQLVILPLFLFSATFYPDRRPIPRPLQRHRPAHAAVPRRRPHPLRSRSGRLAGPPRPRRVPGGDGVRRPDRRLAAARQAAAQVGR